MFKIIYTHYSPNTDYIKFTCFEKMTEHWNEHSLDFSRKTDKPDKKFHATEGDWDPSGTGFTVDSHRKLTEQDMIGRRQVYEDPDPDMRNLQKRKMFTTQVRKDPSYQFLMMVAAFSKKNLGTVMNVTQDPKRRTTTRTRTTQQRRLNPNTQQQILRVTEENPDGKCKDSEFDGDRCAFGANTGKLEGKSWVTMPEISGSIQLTPEVYGHIKEAEMIVRGFVNRHVNLKVLVEETRYQSLFARLVAIRMGLTNYFDRSDQQKDKIFSRLHQEQTMLLRRIGQVKAEQKKDYTSPYY